MLAGFQAEMQKEVADKETELLQRERALATRQDAVTREELLCQHLQEDKRSLTQQVSGGVCIVWETFECGGAFCCCSLYSLESKQARSHQ